MAMERTERYMMVVGRKYQSRQVLASLTNYDSEWAQRIKPSDGFIVKEE
jgi:hypothetical protein